MTNKYECLVCGEHRGTHRLLPHSKSRREYKYVHDECMMLFNSSWDDKIRTNEKLYHLDYIGTCSTCNIKDKRAVIRCAYRYFYLDSKLKLVIVKLSFTTCVYSLRSITISVMIITIQGS